MDSDNTANNLLLSDPLDNIPCLQVHQDRVPCILYTVMLSLNLTERALQPVPLRLILFTALCDGNGVLEGRVVAPESEFLQRGTAGEEIEDRADDSLLLRGEGNAGCGGDVDVFDVEGGCAGLVRDSWDGFSLEFSQPGRVQLGRGNLPVDILADVVNLEICDTVGFDSDLSDVLYVRATENGRICSILEA